MTYDPHTIAREASEQLVVSFSVVAGRDLSPATPQITKLILTAAARMVRESGVREALEAQDIYECHSNKSDHREWANCASMWLRPGEAVANIDYKKRDAALANLAKLGGGG